MALGDPEVGYDAFSPFTIVMAHETDQGTIGCTMEIKFNADGYSPETVLNSFQELLDFMSTSPNFSLVQAQRNAYGYQPITPSA